ncbi:MAG: NERD domain-containing protein [Anaerolineales bacterium]|nr:NERD domain-containing protein [Anaerolineales bacterium]
MAKIIGTSDAWKSVCLALNRANFKPEKPSDIHVFLEATKKEHALAKANATQEIQNKIDELKKDIEQREKNFDIEIQRGRDEISVNIKSTQILLRSLQGSFIQKIFHYFTIRKHRERIRYLKTKYNKFPRLVQKRIDQLKDALEKTQRNFETIIDQQCQATAYKVNLLENVLKSPELAGGIAELELIESLKSLPDNYYVINDVTLEMPRAIRFDGLWLKSAQIDHVVVTPAHIFVIEVKNWSKKFSQDGDYFDPYQQIKRSSYLCYRLIGERYNLSTKSILAHKGYIPNKPTYSNAKVLSIDEVKGYISWFKNSNVSDQIVEKVANWLAS